MKIGNSIIQGKMIKVNTHDHFEANYKGMHIYVSKDHGYGEAIDPDDERFWIEVTNIKNGLYGYEGYFDCLDINAAIYEAMEGACLL